MSKSQLTRLSDQVPEIAKLQKDACRWRWWAKYWIHPDDATMEKAINSLPPCGSKKALDEAVDKAMESMP